MSSLKLGDGRYLTVIVSGGGGAGAFILWDKTDDIKLFT